jgi:hypothetical protein
MPMLNTAGSTGSARYWEQLLPAGEGSGVEMRVDGHKATAVLSKTGLR